MHYELPAGWTNYSSAEEAPEVVDELLNRMLEKGWAEVYENLDDLKLRYGHAGGVPLNKLGLITKVRTDGSRKNRLVWDLRRSGVNDELDQVQRIIFPRLRDVVGDFLEIANGVNVKRPPLLT
eukprot:751871-Amphidinium_carterae.1